MFTMENQVYAKDQIYKLTLNERCGNLCKKIDDHYEELHIKRNLRSGSVYLDKSGDTYIFNSYINLVMELGELVVKSVLNNNENDHIFSQEDLYAVLLVDKYTFGKLYGVSNDDREILGSFICPSRCGKSFSDECENDCGLKGRFN